MTQTSSIRDLRKVYVERGRDGSNRFCVVRVVNTVDVLPGDWLSKEDVVNVMVSHTVVIDRPRSKR